MRKVYLYLKLIKINENTERQIKRFEAWVAAGERMEALTYCYDFTGIQSEHTEKD